MSNYSSTKNIYLFGTCLIDVFYPEAGLATVELLERMGFTVHFPQGQSCCGQPAYNSGYRQEAVAVAEAQICHFQENWPVVVPSGSCAAMLRIDYPALFAGHPLEQQAMALAARVIELTAFLLGQEANRFIDQGEAIRVAVHTSCSTRRALDGASHSLELLGRLQQVEACEPAQAWECCGFGGTFAVKQPAISAVMTEDKCKALEETRATALVSGDCGCLMSLNGRLEKTGRLLQGEHIASFLLRRLTGDSSEQRKVTLNE
jgi:L-lactate dehydrogenase complex protein LldE